MQASKSAFDEIFNFGRTPSSRIGYPGVAPHAAKR